MSYRNTAICEQTGVCLDELAVEIASRTFVKRHDLVPLRVEILLAEAIPLMERCLTKRRSCRENGEAAGRYTGFAVDFSELYQRLVALAEGLALVYGIVETLPAPTSPGDGFLDCLDEWLHSVNYQLVAQHHLDRRQMLSISCAHHAGGVPTLQEKLMNGVLALRISDHLVPHTSIRRILGIDCSVMCPAKPGSIWQFALGNNALEARHGIRPAVFSSTRNQPDNLFGLRNFGDQFFNCDIVGDWQLTCSRSVLNGAPVSAIADVVLDFTLLFH